jgi:uncharacterized protein (TIRG00374 family)
MKLGWRGALGILLSVALLWWTLHDQDLANIWRVLSQSNAGYWVACCVFATAIFPLRALRWATLLEPVGGRLPFASLWQSTAIGRMVNNVVPARAGEVARAFALSRAEDGVKFTAAFASLAVDRLFDGVVILLMMIGAMLDSAFAPSSAGGSGALVLSMRFTAIFLAGVLVVLGFMVVAPQRVFALYDTVVGRLAPRLAPRGRHLLEGFASGLGVLRSPRLVIEVFLWTVLHWLCNALAFWLGFKALGIAVPATAALLLQGIIAIGVALPAAPGFFGLFESTGRFGLGLYGVRPTEAVSWAIGFHIVSYIPITVMGAWYLTRLKLHFRDFGGGGTGRAA